MPHLLCIHAMFSDCLCKPDAYNEGVCMYPLCEVIFKDFNHSQSCEKQDGKWQHQSI